MVAFSNQNKKQHGSGIIDTLLKPFTYERYPGEHHGISMSPNTFGQAFNFMGPHTRLDLRLKSDGTPKDDSKPINNADYQSYKHDLSYDNAKKSYIQNPTQENKNIQLGKVWKADDIFINEMNRDIQEPMSKIADKLIQTKK